MPAVADSATPWSWRPQKKSTCPFWTDAFLEAARSRFYPHWWIHATEVRGVANMPVYRVIVHTVADAQLARASKPEFINAEVELLESGDW